MWIIWLLFAFAALVGNQVEMMFVMLAFAAISGVIGKIKQSNRKIKYLDSLNYSVGEYVHHNEIDDFEQLCPPSRTKNGIILSFDINNPERYYVRYTMNGYGKELKEPIERYQHKRGLRKGWSIC